MKLLLVFVFECFFIISIFAAEDTVTKYLTIDYSLQWNHTLQSITDEPKLIDYNESDYVKKIRFINGSLNNSNNITDNPLTHGASYASVLFQFRPLETLKISLEFFGEHRGSSYGVFNKKNLAFFPLFNISFKDSLNFINQLFKTKKNQVFFNGGILTKIKIDEGLMIYNTDAHGYQLGLRINQFEISRTHYGDFVNYIGLNIDDFINYKFVYYFKDSLYISASYNIANAVHKDKNENNAVLSISSRINKFYGSIGFRNHNSNTINDYYLRTYDLLYNTNSNNYSVAFLDQLSLLIGYQNAFKTKKSNTDISFELRYYGKFFNYNRINSANKYRDPNLSTLYGNTIGDNLYPIYRTNYNFSQWNIFSEYVGKNILGFSIDFKQDYNLYKKLFFDFQIDANFLKPSNEKLGLFAFYRTGFKLKLIDKSEVFVGITNKTMNLDVHYPTFYSSTIPLPTLNLRKWIY